MSAATTPRADNHAVPGAMPDQFATAKISFLSLVATVANHCQRLERERPELRLLAQAAQAQRLAAGVDCPLAAKIEKLRTEAMIAALESEGLA